jgi:apolipoprotein N-acyltransferase
MKSLNAYRFAGILGGLLLAAGQFRGPACILQLAAILPLMLLILRDRRIGPAALAGLYMGLTFTFPQMIYLRMPLPVTVILLLHFTLLLVILCMAAAYFLPRHPVLGPLAFGAFWYVLDWLNYTLVPLWGMAQSFARSWTAYPFAIQFISITSISGVLFVIGAFQGLAAHVISARPHTLNTYRPQLVTACALLGVTFAYNAIIWFDKPDAAIKVAAAGWGFDDRSSTIDPHKPEGFEQLFAAPARTAAAQGARLFTTGEMGFYIADHERAEWNARFADVARQTNIWLVIGYYNVTLEENRVFFMSPQGDIVHEYTKTYLTPYEPGHKGDGSLKSIELDGLTIGAMICQDDNFSRLTRRYGTNKADLVLCPTADWWTIKTAHLQAVGARAIEGRFSLARGAANGISAIFSPRGELLAKRDHCQCGPGVIIADIPVYKGITLFSRFGHAPSLLIAAAVLAMARMKTPAPAARISNTPNQPIDAAGLNYC